MIRYYSPNLRHPKLYNQRRDQHKTLSSNPHACLHLHAYALLTGQQTYMITTSGRRSCPRVSNLRCTSSKIPTGWTRAHNGMQWQESNLSLSTTIATAHADAMHAWLHVRSLGLDLHVFSDRTSHVMSCHGKPMPRSVCDGFVPLLLEVPVRCFGARCPIAV